MVLTAVLLVVAVGGWHLSKSRSVRLFGGLVTRVETGERPGSIVSLVVGALRERGYRFVMVPELLARRNPPDPAS